jgi:AmmeMemoRadiSam system protein A
VLSDPDRRSLLLIARDAIVAHVNGATPPVVEPSGALGRPAGAFVSLHVQGQLRGCIGHLDADRPVACTVAGCAVAACSADPRFPAVTPVELLDIVIEVSVLGRLEPVATLDDIEVGRHGLVIERGSSRGLLLPQVATEWGWNARSFVEHTCRKAGLAIDAWRSGARLWTFEAEVFAEERAASSGP